LSYPSQSDEDELLEGPPSEGLFPWHGHLSRPDELLEDELLEDELLEDELLEDELLEDELLEDELLEDELLEEGSLLVELESPRSSYGHQSG
jgi:hypothetical protein